MATTGDTPDTPKIHIEYSMMNGRSLGENGRRTRTLIWPLRVESVSRPDIGSGAPRREVATVPNL